MTVDYVMAPSATLAAAQRAIAAAIEGGRGRWRSTCASP